MKKSTVEVSLPSGMLTHAQTAALSAVRVRALDGRHDAQAKLASILARHGISQDDNRLLVSRMSRSARVTLNFHPDRLRRDGISVVEGLLTEGLYRNQFETGVTNGSPTAFSGGERDRWEERLFAGAYQSLGSEARERPKYGALNLFNHPDGGCPRFGSCYLDLRPSVTSRCTFTWGQSNEIPEHIATADALEPIAAALLAAVETTGEALGMSGLDVPTVLRRVADARSSDQERDHGRALDACIEAQVHGDVDLSTDVDAVVVDPSFQGTVTGDGLRKLASQHGFTLRWHRGFALRAVDVPSDFRGPRMLPLAARVAPFASVRGQLDAATLGRGAVDLHRNPEAWSDWATPAETWQHIKQLWHVLVRFGGPFDDHRPK